MGARPSSCVLCHLSRRLERPQIALEAMLIWLPEFSQGALNALVRGIHLCLLKHEKSLSVERRALSGPLEARAAQSAYLALTDRGEAAKRRLDTTSPRDLAEALLELSPASYAQRERLLDGARLLSLGRFFHGGRDVYREVLAASQEGARPASQTGDSIC